MSKQPAAVIGIGQTHHRAKREDVSMAGLCREAIDRALEDAGLTLDEVDAIVVGKAPDLFEGVMMPELFLAEALGAVGKPLLRVHTAGSVGGSTAIVAASLVQAGVHRTVLTVAYEKQSESNAMWALSVPVPFNMPVHAGAGGYFAPHVRSYIRRSGAPSHVGAVVAAKDRQNALRNPYAHLRNPDTTVETVLASQMLWDPIRYDETCPSSDGACALVIASEDVAASSPNPAWIHGTVMRSEATSAAERDQVNPQASRDAAAALWKQAGITEPAPRRSTPPRSTCRSRGSSRCGWSRWASPRRARAGSSPSRAGPRWTASSRSTAPAECCRPTRSAPRGCSASARPPSRCGAQPASTRSTAYVGRSATPTAAAPSSSPCGWSGRRSRATEPPVDWTA